MSCFITKLSFNLQVNFFLICEHLAKLKVIWCIMSYAQFALDFCPQRCRTHQISKISCAWRTETVTDCCYVNRQIDVSLLSQMWNCCRPVSTYWLTDLCHQWLTTDCWSCAAFCCNIFFFVTAVVCSRQWDFYMAGAMQCRTTALASQNTGPVIQVWSCFHTWYGAAARRRALSCVALRRIPEWTRLYSFTLRVFHVFLIAETLLSCLSHTGCFPARLFAQVPYFLKGERKHWLFRTKKTIYRIINVTLTCRKLSTTVVSGTAEHHHQQWRN